MDRGSTALRDAADSPLSVGVVSRRGKWSRQSHHRRRRALALLGFLILMAGVAVLLSTTSGGAAHRVHAGRPEAFFARLETLAASVPGSLVAAEDAGIDRTLAYTPYVRVAGAQHREIALTFDDGPGPYTPRIVSILERDRVPATFFEVGVLERYFHASTTRIVADGDVIGDHTFYHAPMSRLVANGQRAELLQDARTLGRYGVGFPRLFRPPYGLWNASTLALLSSYRMLMVLWTVDTEDYRLPGTAAIVRTTLAGARPGAIILLHDGGGNRTETVAALPKIIAKLRSRGYRLVTVPRLLLDNPPPRSQQVLTLVGRGG